MGILNSFIYMFSTEIRIHEIPEEYKKYFPEISDFNSDHFMNKEIACKAMIRKLKDEVYFRVEIDADQLEKAKIGGLTGYDINLPMAIDKSKLQIITDANNNVLSAYDVAHYIYEKTKNSDIFKDMCGDFFYMFEVAERKENMDYNVDTTEKKR